MESIFFLGLNMYAWITIIALASLMMASKPCLLPTQKMPSVLIIIVR